ncbi:TIGR02221 family CRISPR-associated protein [Prevotella falsenii]|uniref:TIGR02221 family CRISPR-associated protein n=1 Tax=Prevotella falsenii TaxID=515414 RepID=UPI000A00F632|nr:TIGR02221 family CRISPR-associated protein [Prevotella falsenii]
MERKVFVSFLGTSNYVETYYTFNGEKSSHPVRFIQETLISSLCKQWTQEDKILIFCTKDSEKKNWLDNGHQNTETEGLSTRLRKMNLPVQIEMVGIAEGFSEEDIWSIFNCVYSKLEKGDNIYFDVTHTFRSIPMFSTILFNYAHYLKGTNLMAVYYGAFDKLGPTQEVSKMPVEDRIAPVIDLTGIIRLQELSAAANNLHQYGKMTTLSDLMKSVKGKGKFSQDIIRARNKMNTFDTAISTCDMDTIKKGDLAKELQTLVKSIKDSAHLTEAHKKLLTKVEEEISTFQPHNTDKNVEAAIDWTRRFGMIQQAYTLARELTISKVQDLILSKNELLQNESDKDCREFISALLSLDTKIKEYSNPNKELEALFNRLRSEEDVVKALYPSYSKLANDRNTINHGKKRDKDFIKQFDKNYGEIKKILQGVDIERAKSERKMFINFSNHPLAMWTPAQLAAAQEYGETVEIAFPNIGPELTNTEVQELATDYVAKIVEHYPTDRLTVHIMGEMNFCYNVVQQLKAHGIRCVASTTERIVQETDTDQKLTRFSFVRFREY